MVSESDGPESPVEEPAESPVVSGERLCDYCRLPIPGDRLTGTWDSDTYAFCSEGCRDAMVDADKVFTQYHGFRRTPTGVKPIDESLPQGVPRNSFVMLTDLAGTRTEAIRAELVWRALQRDEPVVVVSFLEPPVSVIQEFVTLDWNVLPYLESGQLGFVDAFTYRMNDRDQMYDCLNDWNKHLATFCEPATTRVRDPSDTSELRSRVEDALEQRDMQDQGILVVDSLNEFGSLMQPMQAYRFVKDLRATVAKSRFVPVYASATVTDDGSGFPHDLDYMVDGIVELHLDDELVEGSLMKQVRVRKMSGVLNLPQWALYEYTAGEGIVTIDPRKGPTDGDGEETSATDTAVDPNGDGVAGEPEPGDTADHPGNTDPTSGSADESAGPASEADDAESDEA